MSYKRAFIIMNFCVILYGFTGIFGKLIQAETETLVFIRVFLAVLGLLFYAILIKLPFQRLRNKRDFFQLLSIGFLIAFHWLAFFEAIKVSNITVALIGFSTAPMFTAFLEPIYFKKKIPLKDVFISILIIAGISIIMLSQTNQFQFNYGLLLGIFSGLLASVFTILNKDMVTDYDAYHLSLYQLSVALIPLFFFNIYDLSAVFRLSSMDWLYLSLLAFVCTSLAHVLSIHVMRQLNAYVVTMLVNMEPVYSIVLALILFSDSEVMTIHFYLGAVLIMASMFIHSYLHLGHFKEKHA